MTWPTRFLCLAITGVYLGCLVHCARPRARRAAKAAAPDASPRRADRDRSRAEADGRSAGRPPAPVVLPPAPRQDLLLTGLIGMGSQSSALFTITEPNQPSRSFGLHEGEQNAWMTVRSIDVERGKVRVILKRPVVRVRRTGVDVVLSLIARGWGAPPN